MIGVTRPTSPAWAPGRSRPRIWAPPASIWPRAGVEVGTTTGRSRRCGWFDAVLLRYAARLNGLTELFLTKLDVLSGLETVKVCTAYRHEGSRYDDVPPHQSIFHRAEPEYEELEGWPEDLGGAATVEDLPAAARKYVERIAELGGVPVRHCSVGPDRDQTLSGDLKP